MRILAVAWLSCGAIACTPTSRAGPPVRLAIGTSEGTSDTVVLNHQRPTGLGIRALDSRGRVVPGAPVQYARVRGPALPVDATTGAVTCARAGDLIVRATLGQLAKDVLVRCRPVEHVRIPGPVQFILGDAVWSQPRPLPVEAYSRQGERIALIAGSAQVADGGIATLRGLTLHPRKRGITVAGVQVGDRSAGIGVHIYQRVDDLRALDTLLQVPPTQRLFAVPLRLERGQYRRQRLPPGGWMLAMLPEEPPVYGRAETIQLRVEGADCQPNFLNAPRRFGCRAGSDAAVIVYLSPASADSVVAGDLLVRRL